MSQVITPQLSMGDQLSYEMGVAAFSLLLEEMICHKDNIPFKLKTIELTTSIIERESTLKK